MSDEPITVRGESTRFWGAVLVLFDGQRRTLAIAVGLSILQALSLLPVAVLVQRCFDRYIPDADIGKLVAASALIFGLFLLQGVLGLVTRRVTLKVTKRSIAELRGRLLERIYALPQSFFDAEDDARVQSIVVQDTERIDLMVNAIVALLLPAYAVSIGLGVVMFVIDPVLSFYLCAVVPFLFIAGRVLRRRLVARVKTWTKSFEIFSRQTTFAVRTSTLTKVQSAASGELDRRRAEHVELGQTSLEMNWAQAVYGIVQNAIAASAGVLVLVVGGIAVAHHDLTFGELLSYYAVLALLLRQLQTAFTVLPQVHAGRESMERLKVVAEATDLEPYAGTREIDFQGGLELDGVFFGYDRGAVLHDVSLSVAPGERILLLGPNGAGKSTVVSLMLGLYRPDVGMVRADGVPYDELDLSKLRRSMGVVLQDPVIFPGTIRDNIAYGRPEATDEDVERAARLAGAHDYIVDLPESYATHVGDEGTLLSGGQRQRIAIARAMIARPGLLVLDEPTTHLDDRAIADLMRTLAELPGRPTVVMISHDPALTARADVVARLRDGRLAALERPLTTA
jgi:ABC-type multidrug transport system fused ATPase/permease subunit